MFRGGEARSSLVPGDTYRRREELRARRGCRAVVQLALACCTSWRMRPSRARTRGVATPEVARARGLVEYAYPHTLIFLTPPISTERDFSKKIGGADFTAMHPFCTRVAPVLHPPKS